MGVAVRRYIDILIIIITFPFSTIRYDDPQRDLSDVVRMRKRDGIDVVLLFVM